MSRAGAATSPFVFVAGVVGAAIVAAGAIAISDLSVMWQLLMLIAILGAVALVWTRRMASVLLCGYVFTLPLVITKSLVRQGGVYTPGLELSLSDLFLLALIPVWFVQRFSIQRRAPRIICCALPITMYYANIWVSGFFAESRLDGILAAITMSKGLLGFFMITEFTRDVIDTRRVLGATAAGLAVQIGMALLQAVLQMPIALQGVKASNLGTHVAYAEAGGVSAFRPYGTLLHPNVFACYLVMLLPVVIVLMLRGPKHVGRATHVIATLLTVGASGVLLLSLSRGGRISGTLAVLALFWLGVRRGLVRPTAGGGGRRSRVRRGGGRGHRPPGRLLPHRRERRPLHGVAAADDGPGVARHPGGPDVRRRPVELQRSGASTHPGIVRAHPARISEGHSVGRGAQRADARVGRAGDRRALLHGVAVRRLRARVPAGPRLGRPIRGGPWR